MRKIIALALVALMGVTAEAQQTGREQQNPNRQQNQQANQQGQHKDQHNLSWGLVAAINSCQSQLAETSIQQGAGQARDSQKYEQQFASTDKLFEPYTQGQQNDNSLTTCCVTYYNDLKQFAKSGGSKEQIPSFTSLNNAVVQAITANELWDNPQYQQVAQDMLKQSWSEVQKYKDSEDEAIKKMQKDATTLVASIQQMHNIQETDNQSK